jgi:lipopolysaccharide/colanic/teichoic acid biosynthesis glycosyltransferase
MLSPIILVLIIIGYFETRSPIFRQERVGKSKKPFHLVKFRSMYLNSPSVATHLASVSSITPFGSFLRKTKMDELPQLWNVLVEDMSLVGPRPNLYNQEDLIEERYSRGVYSVRPGITGLAQINKIDMSTPQLLAETDAKMIQELNILGYFKYILLTIFGKGFGDRVKSKNT